MIFIDSNIWCYYFNESSKEHKKAVKVLEESMERETIFVNTVTLMEVSHYLIKNLGAKKGKEKIDLILSLPIKIIDFSFKMLEASVKQLAENSNVGIGGRDATILATMLKEGVEKLLTNDYAFKKVKWIRVVGI